MKKNKNLKEICEAVDMIIENKDGANDYKNFHLDLYSALQKVLDFDEIVLFCDAVLRMSTAKNRRLRYIEKDFWDFIKRVPIQLLHVQKIDFVQAEVIEAGVSYDNEGKKILSALLDLSKKILELPGEKSVVSGYRKAAALDFVSLMINYYDYQEAGSLFLKSIVSNNKKEQLSALVGLETVFEYTDEEIGQELVDALNSIIRETDQRIIASSCLQILINANVIDTFEAVCIIDDWKERNYYR